MKKLAFIAIVVFAFACKKESSESFGKEDQNTTVAKEDKELAPEELGKVIFESKGNCISCHKTDEKLIGPSLQDIAKIYKEKNGNIVTFLKGESEAIVDPSQFAVMQANLTLTKTFSDKELQGLEAYIYSNLK
ncbi:cytochrome c [Flavobacterium glycines]|uniref:Cytochrome c n=1 Tax=Flavobacterium glycines TaxID=551990 RepID=A0A1B9DP19_9FLAO|nr:c-type cytochrome [Flavobacterium glycines]OCB71415.1 cytochrome C552 [Flavobacterium glycines]GEL10434.1 cytochrome c552 [Flavobacterium glycines]SDI68220.1 cytochrome c [Flavobacterium glycines]